MLFRLHTHFGVNNSFSFSKSLRKQVGQWSHSRVKGSGKPVLPSSVTLGATVPTEEPGGTPVGKERHFLHYEGLLGNSHLCTVGGVPFPEHTWSLMSDQKLDSYPEWD